MEEGHLLRDGVFAKQDSNPGLQERSGEGHHLLPRGRDGQWSHRDVCFLWDEIEHTSVLSNKPAGTFLSVSGCSTYVTESCTQYL